MSDVIRKELRLSQSPERVWQAIATSESLAEWMYPNDFEPVVGHAFTFHVPAKPEVGFDGLVVDCEVLECEPPRRLVFSWTAGGAVTDTRVSFELEAAGEGTHLVFEHSGFDLTDPFGKQALEGARFGWASMLEKLASVLGNSAV